MFDLVNQTSIRESIETCDAFSIFSTHFSFFLTAPDDVCLHIYICGWLELGLWCEHCLLSSMSSFDLGDYKRLFMVPSASFLSIWSTSTGKHSIEVLRSLNCTLIVLRVDFRSRVVDQIMISLVLNYDTRLKHTLYNPFRTHFLLIIQCMWSSNAIFCKFKALKLS